jgi:hypothetical protein
VAPRFRALLFGCLTVLAAAAHAESFFDLQVVAQRGDSIDVAVVHRADDSTTPTAAWAALRLVTDRAGAALESVQPTPDGQTSLRVRRPRPRAQMPGHEAHLLVRASGESAARALPRDGEVVRVRLRVLEMPARLTLEADRERGGLRAWNGLPTPVGREPLATLVLDRESLSRFESPPPATAPGS